MPAAPQNFVVHGPFVVPVERRVAGRVVTSANAREFWELNADFRSSRGCYIFGIRSGGGFTPGYIGKATKTFEQECFTSHKIGKYHELLADYRRGTPVMFLIEQSNGKGKPNLLHIKELEAFLIQNGVARNPQLLNVKGTRQAQWGIRGVLRSPGGKPSRAAQDFRKMMHMN